MRRLGNHPSAEMVYDAVHIEHPSISKATVYRILKDEAEQGTLRNIDVPGGVHRYDHRTDNHWHIRCRRCGRICDVELSDVRLPEAVAPEGWNVENMSVIMSGLCADCRDAELSEAKSE